MHRDFSGIETIELDVPVDSDIHGTHVAGIIGAEPNNDLGITGTCWNVNIVSLRINVGGSWFSSRVIRAVDYAIDAGIDVLNYSGRTRNEITNIAPYDDPALAQMIRLFPGLFICAAGNYNSNNDEVDMFPANYTQTHDNVIAVGAYNESNQRWYYSNYGEETVSIYAPGEDITSCVPGDNYRSLTGTSMATPYVTGVAALLLSINQSLTVQQLRTAILQSAVPFTITVPNPSGTGTTTQNVVRLNAYNAVKYVLENYSNTAYTLSNYSSNVNTNKTITSGASYFNELNGFYKLNVTYAKNYEFISSSTSGIKVTLYDEDFNEVSYSNLDSTNNKVHFIQNLSVGTYYLRTQYINEESTGIINTKIVSRNTTYLNYNQNDILVNTYNGIDDYYYINSRGAGFYKFTLIGTKADGTTVTYPAGAIKIYNDSSKTTPMDKFSLTGYSNQAVTNLNENSFVVYLSRNGYFYLDVNMSSNNLSSLYLSVTSVDSQELNMFNLSESTNETINIFNETTKGDSFKKLEVKQSGKFTVTTSYSGIQTADILFVLAKLNYNSTSNTYSLTTRIVVLMNNDNDSYSTTLSLSDGTYYIGYFNKDDTSNFNITFNRLVTQSGSNVLVTDPDFMTPTGSQISIIEMNQTNKSYRQTFITKNFTRLIYPDYNFNISASRLDYYWYSSDESKATVTDYGTVLGKSIGTVKIMAVLKSDPSKVFVKEFTIINYTGGDIVVNDEYRVKYSDLTNGTFHLNLEQVNCPYPWLQDYYWTLDTTCHNSGITANMDQWGNITVNGTGCFTLEGIYIRMANVTVVIHVIVEP